MTNATDTLNWEALNWIEKWARYSPHAVAFKDADREIHYTYAHLHHLVVALAQKLENTFGVREGDRVACVANNELEFIPLFFALQRLGATLVPVNFRLTSREIRHILTDCEPCLVIHQKQFSDVIAETLADVAKEIPRWLFDGQNASNLVSFLAEIADGPTIAVPSRAKTDSVCMILYTSGTTGRAKGAMITNRMLHWNSLNTILRLDLSQTDVQISFLPLFHTGGWNVLLTPFVHRGARTVLTKKFEASRILQLCESEGATILFGVPTTMEMMSRAPEFPSVNLVKVRYAVVGGEAMPIELIKTWQRKGIPVRQGYGLTEFGPNVFSLNEEDSLRKMGSIGFPNFYVQTCVVDADDQEVGPNEIGELCLRGPVCTPGYWRDETTTRETIRGGWLHTGDLVRRDEDGYFYVVGRKKDMFISGGENVYPVEVETYLGTHPAVREIAVIGIPDEKWGEVGRAFVALKDGCACDARELTEFAVRGLAKFKVPKEFVFMAELPKGDSGKLLKRQLRDQPPT